MTDLSWQAALLHGIATGHRAAQPADSAGLHFQTHQTGTGEGGSVLCGLTPCHRECMGAQQYECMGI